ncbi:MAG: hypothetical protein LLG24_07050 [Actinomycetia bacterium]|nr:hypothetical protein [Actinomycetes bacterium]
MKLSMSHRRISMAVLVSAILLVPAFAYANPYSVNRHEDQYHWGVSADVYVFKYSTSNLNTNTTIVAHRTDHAGFVEVGHGRVSQNPYEAFYVWGEYGGYNYRAIRAVNALETHRYWTAYNAGEGAYWVWMDDSSVPVGKINISQVAGMTSSWPCVNVDKALVTDEARGCFKTLKYRNQTWGSWSYWNGSAFCCDNDPYYSARVISPTHIDVVQTLLP